MRLWSFHPKYLDHQTLYLTWKRGMIAVRALTGNLAGYERTYANHGQLVRFKEMPDPVQAISDYMHALVDESQRRGYTYPRYFKRKALPKSPNGTRMTVTAGQLESEVWCYADILGQRRGMIEEYVRFFGVHEHDPHPVFTVVRGPKAEWERFG